MFLQFVIRWKDSDLGFFNLSRLCLFSHQQKAFLFSLIPSFNQFLSYSYLLCWLSGVHFEILAVPRVQWQTLEDWVYFPVCLVDVLIFPACFSSYLSSLFFRLPTTAPPSFQPTLNWFYCPLFFSWYCIIGFNIIVCLWCNCLDASFLLYGATECCSMVLFLAMLARLISWSILLLVDAALLFYRIEVLLDIHVSSANNLTNEKCI